MKNNAKTDLQEQECGQNIRTEAGELDYFLKEYEFVFFFY